MGQNADDVSAELGLAGAIDLALLALISSLLTLPAYVLGYEHTLAPDIMLTIAAIVLYMAVSARVLRATPGQAILGIRIILRDGDSASALLVALRSVLRPFGDRILKTSARRQSGFGWRRAIFVGAAISGFVVLEIALVVPVSDILLGGGPPLIAMIAVSGFVSLLTFSAGRALFPVTALSLLFVASIGSCVSWTNRDLTAGDHLTEIESLIDQAVPPGTSEADLRAFLDASHKGYDGPRTFTGTYASNSGLRQGDEYVEAFFPHAAQSGLCPVTLAVFFVIRDGRVDHVNYAPGGDGCP